VRKLLVFGLFVNSLFAYDISEHINVESCSQVIDKEYYDICYSYEQLGALAVGYELDGNLVNEVNIKKRPSFYVEEKIPEKYRTYNSDYTHSGRDRGHLANDAAFDYSKDSLNSTYSFGNIIPMDGTVNRYYWTKAEKHARKMATKYGKVEVLNLVIYSDNPEKLGNSQISIPEGYYKIISSDESSFKQCYYYENKKNPEGVKDTLNNHLVDCSSL